MSTFVFQMGVDVKEMTEAATEHFNPIGPRSNPEQEHNSRTFELQERMNVSQLNGMQSAQTNHEKASTHREKEEGEETDRCAGL
jgi:hypothetical protein